MKIFKTGFLRHDHRIHVKKGTAISLLHPVTNSVNLAIPGGLLPSSALFRFARWNIIKAIDIHCQLYKIKQKKMLNVRGHLALL